MGCPVIATARGCSSGRAGEAAGPRRPGGRTCCWWSTGAGPPTCGRPARRPQGLSPDGRDGPRPHGDASRGGFDGVLARKAHGGPGNARTGGEVETLRWVSDDLFPEAGDCPGLGQLEHAPRGVALRDVPVKGGRAAGLPPRGPSHTQARFAPADGARSSRACY